MMGKISHIQHGISSQERAETIPEGLSVKLEEETQSFAKRAALDGHNAEGEKNQSRTKRNKKKRPKKDKLQSSERGKVLGPIAPSCLDQACYQKTLEWVQMMNNQILNAQKRSNRYLRFVQKAGIFIQILVFFKQHHQSKSNKIVHSYFPFINAFTLFSVIYQVIVNMEYSFILISYSQVKNIKSESLEANWQASLPNLLVERQP